MAVLHEGGRLKPRVVQTRYVFFRDPSHNSRHSLHGRVPFRAATDPRLGMPHRPALRRLPENAAAQITVDNSLATLGGTSDGGGNARSAPRRRRETVREMPANIVATRNRPEAEHHGEALRYRSQRRRGAN